MNGLPPQPDVVGAEQAGLGVTPWLASGRHVAGWALKVMNFGFLQGLVQLLMALAGLIIVRYLPKSEYALFAIANSIQVVCTQLADVGIGIGVRSIGGRVWQDRSRLGQLIQTALGLRRQFALVAAAVCFPLMVWLLRRNGASPRATAGLCLAVATSVIPLLGITVWSATLLLHGRYRSVQRLDLGNGLLRLALIAGLALSRINAVLAALVGTVSNIVQAVFVRRWARDVADPKAPTNPDDRRELIRLSLKSLPNTIFFCLQGQITLFILTLTRNPSGIADLTALGRLALLFAVFSVMFSNVLAPRFARCLDQTRLGRLYLLLVGGTILVLLPVVIAAFLFPGPFLWLLGDKYSGLRQECGWVVAAGCLTQLLAVFWGLNSSKAWISIQAVGYIPIIVTAQVIAAFCLDLRQFHAVVLFTVITAAAPIPLMIADAILGLNTARAGVRPETD
jgi:O-antigen/teichoic acid export membrane protein